MQMILGLIFAAIFVNDNRRPYQAIDKCIRGLIRGNLNAKAHGNPELNSKGKTFDKCVETIDSPSHVDDKIVQPSSKDEKRDAMSALTSNRVLTPQWRPSPLLPIPVAWQDSMA